MLQDAEGPEALSDLCLTQVCCSLDALCSRRADGSMCLSWALLFPQEVVDQLLRKMGTKGRSGGKEKHGQHKYLPSDGSSDASYRTTINVTHP